VIVDECHHLSAFSFEQVMRQVKAKYVVGLTATPTRKDGHHPIIFMQCGPVRFMMKAREAAAWSPFQHLALPRHTDFRMPTDGRDPKIHDVHTALVANADRNHQINADILAFVAAGRTPLLTHRTDHVERLALELSSIEHVLILKGGMGKKQRQAVAEKQQSIPEGSTRIILATGSYIGEGFDDSRLDTLFLTMPISWRGTLQQYVGRLHCSHDGKNAVRVYDYVDNQGPMRTRMYERRLRGYNAIGYELDGESGDAGLSISGARVWQALAAVCNKRLKRKSYDATLRPHVSSSGWACDGCQDREATPNPRANRVQNSLPMPPILPFLPPQLSVTY
jgi:superfamily II DNA or RNA helicase